MRKCLNILILIFILPVYCFSQRMTIAGNVQDTVAKTHLQYAVAMALKIKDSTLVAFTRSDAKGNFVLNNLPIDTLQIIVSHPRFAEQSYYVFGSSINYSFDFGKIILPPKSQQLKEVVIYAFKDPVYYKGDTLVYTADSFKVKPNATVEDLLKKLPGIKVDGQGKITSQGKTVDQVLVDGDEFFGADPTIATKNLAANAVESVQVYEKKNESSAEGTEETVNVMNLKLKEDAKKGYFGKVSGAGDFQKFYEGELLANKFTNKQKVSVFALGSNTPRSGFGWNEMYKYGLENEMNVQSDDSGDMWYSNESINNGIPKTFKSGVYYNDKLSENTKLNFNYSYSNNQLKAKSQTRSQYFLTDTSYTTENTSEATQLNESHNLNLGFTQQLDSLTELNIIPKLKYNKGKTETSDIEDFISAGDTLTRRTTTANNNSASGYNLNALVKLNRKFKNRDRSLFASYNYSKDDNESTGNLKSGNQYFLNTLFPATDINQKKVNKSESQINAVSIDYTEPLTKKIKLEFKYDFNYSLSKQNKNALNFYNGEYSVQDSAYSNNFENKRMSNRLGTEFRLETNKHLIAIGAKIRQITSANTNLISHRTINQNLNSILPSATYRYKITDNKRLYFNYNTNSSMPSINQLQPVPDNSNPNQVKLGNPDLKPTFKNTFVIRFNSWKPITGKYYWANMNYSITSNAYSNSITYDSLGRTVTQPINVNGNKNASAYFGLYLPFFSKKISLGPNLNWSYSQYSSYINNQKNSTKTKSINGDFQVDINLDTLDFSMGYSYSYDDPSSTLNTASNKPYTQQKFNASLSLRLPFKMNFSTDAEYYINSQRTPGYNINYVLWNASLSKTFFKLENFIVSVEATDILNQNIKMNRSIQDNVITDTKTNIINRFILLRAVYKFNSSKTKEDENDF